MKRLEYLKLIKFCCLSFLLVIFSRSIFPKGKSSNDREQIIKIEKTWLASLHDKTALDTILANDFVHPVTNGIFLTKDQHINWVVNHPDLSGNIQKFDTLFVRIYNNTGIANGIVATLNKHGKLIRRSIFTDVFIRRNGSWQAVNGQENLIK